MRLIGTLFGIVVAAVALARPAAGSSLTPKQAAAIDAIFAEKITPQSPGCGVGLIRHGEIIEQLRARRCREAVAMDPADRLPLRIQVQTFPGRSDRDGTSGEVRLS